MARLFYLDLVQFTFRSQRLIRKEFPSETRRQARSLPPRPAKGGAIGLFLWLFAVDA